MSILLLLTCLTSFYWFMVTCTSRLTCLPSCCWFMIRCTSRLTCLTSLYWFMITCRSRLTFLTSCIWLRITCMCSLTCLPSLCCYHCIFHTTLDIVWAVSVRWYRSKFCLGDVWFYTTLTIIWGFVFSYHLMLTCFTQFSCSIKILCSRIGTLTLVSCTFQRVQTCCIAYCWCTWSIEDPLWNL